MKSISTILSIDKTGRLQVNMETSSPERKSRDKKGNSLLYSTGDFTAIDIETTGTSTSYDSIIEVGAIQYRSGEAVAQFQALVNPGYKIPDYISDLTGISDEMLKDARSIIEVLPEYTAFIGEDIVLGHNAHFDVNFIYDACIQCGLPAFSNDIIDTLRISRLLYKDWECHTLRHIASCLGVSGGGWHRSLADCDIAARCYLKMMDENPDFGKKKVQKKSLKINSIVPNVDQINEGSPLNGKNCVFTGTLSIPRADAVQIAVNCGAAVRSAVSKNTDFLIMGDQDLSRVADGMSAKEEKAHALNESGDANIKIIGESEFIEMVGEAARA